MGGLPVNIDILLFGNDKMITCLIIFSKQKVAVET
jgi:hypothetical protein